MTLESIVSEMRELVDTLWVEMGPAERTLADLFAGVECIDCSAEKFTEQARLITAEEASILLGATLHRSMAFSPVEYVRLDRARNLASAFVAQFEAGAKFYSNCGVPCDEAAGIGAWHFKVTRHTFESVLYCLGTQNAALLVAIEED